MSILEVIVGTQFGSEGKGHVTAQRVAQLMSNGIEVWNVRVAGPNAGHCVIDPSTGYKYAFRALPVGAAFGAKCVIASGSEIDLDVLESEMRLIELNGRTIDLYVDGQATVLTHEHIKQEQDSDLNAKAGSTAKGIGAARADRLWRTAKIVDQDPEAIRRINALGGTIGNTQDLLTQVAEYREKAIVIEGTQGYGLGLHAGHYPQCTSSNTRATDFLAMAGITPWHQGVELFGVWGATRVYPIRVAGNSGSLKGETSWDELGLDKEYTTVTKKERRVGEWDGPLVRNAVRANGVGVTMLALTMSDQKFPELAGKTGRHTLAELPIEVQHWIQQIEVETNAAVAMVTTGEDTAFYVMPEISPRSDEHVIEEAGAGAEDSDSGLARDDSAEGN